MILITSKLTNSGRVPMQVIDFFIGGNIPYLCEAFVCANCYQITLSNKSTMLPYSPSICNMFSLQMCNDNSTQFNNTQLQKNLIRQYYRIQSCIFNQLQF